MTLSERAIGGLRTRADRVRARRAKLVREIEAVPPERRVKSRRNRKPRRRLDLALRAEVGAEARLPAIPSIRIGSRLVSILLISITILVLRYSFTSSYFNVERATVLGNKILNDSQVRSIAHVDDRLVFLIDPREVEERLSQFPEVYKATVSLHWPNQVKIHVVERKPVVEWNDAGRIWWISLDGVAFIQHGTWPELVQVSTSEPTLKISKEPLDPVIAPWVVNAAVRLNSRLPEIPILKYEKERGLWLEDSNGWRVYFGIEGDMDLKVDIYRAMVEQLSEKHARIDLVSLENQAAPYYRIMR
jgi:cell division septal protein FtsQ